MAPDVLGKAEARNHIPREPFSQHAFDADCEDGGGILLCVNPTIPMEDDRVTHVLPACNACDVLHVGEPWVLRRRSVPKGIWILAKQLHKVIRFLLPQTLQVIFINVNQQVLSMSMSRK